MILREMRKAVKKTQDSVGKELGVEKSSVSKWETGAAYPHPSKIKPLAQLYGTTTDKILTACKEAHEQKLNST